ncbi:hypothetical protein chiPu_0017721 [Chiloscyllium punctatum]|uniref:Uncharacterized protein n=1 Tax=Chiloscyllium punctatum TaxID=137246 RepID=A0A401RIE6_CHIPU|nr:hypothetical protein [Chiloscyllium punctatum]
MMIDGTVDTIPVSHGECQVPAVGINRELWIVWMSMGAVLGAIVFAGAVVLFCIRCIRKPSSSSANHSDGNLPPLDCEPIPLSGDTQETGFIGTDSTP